MPDSGHVIVLVNLLRRASAEYRLMCQSGFDRSRAANEEIRRHNSTRMTEVEKQAASVWLDYLDQNYEAEMLDARQEELERRDGS